MLFNNSNTVSINNNAFENDDNNEDKDKHDKNSIIFVTVAFFCLLS